jgi:tRNA threonylcarbamoyladenosine biosynthesis protein TsaB
VGRAHAAAGRSDRGDQSLVIVLGIGTSTAQVGCALWGNQGPIASFHATRGRHHAETLAPAIDFVCRQGGVELREVGAVAVDIGPGLFTGLRVGISTAKALATALRLPMIGMASLDLLSYPERRSNRSIAAIIDARRREVFWALYRAVPGGVQRLTDYAVNPPEEVASELMARAEETLAVGDGACRYGHLFSDVSHVELAGPARSYPSASVLAELAHPLALREQFVHPSTLSPLYLRKADVRISWEHRGGIHQPAGAATSGDGR